MGSVEVGLSVEVELYCDGVPHYGCNTNPIFHKTGVLARAEARSNGWLTNAPGGKDYCPEHRHLARGSR
jgi:hypothetical protein